MKKFILAFTMFSAMTAVMTFTSCSNEATTPEVEGGETVDLTGAITANMTLNANNEYFLTGSLIVNDGATLTIPAGTTIKAKKGFDKYILVAQGGKIIAEGTADKPITFTADKDNAGAGYWGGLIINGKAPISGVTAGETGLTEINNDYKYGGTNAADNSGKLKFVKLIYTGANDTDEVEHNGLTLNAVGNGTEISDIFVIDGADDAVEFFGGSVNVTNLLAVNPEDDMFDFTQGYTGTLSNCYGIWEASHTSGEKDPRGVEADGNLDGKRPTDIQQSDFKVTGMTIDNRSTGTVMDDAIKIRRGAKATITNALVKGTGKVKNLIDLVDGNGNAANGTSIAATKESTIVLTGDETVLGDVTATITIAAGNAGADKTKFAWTGYTSF